MGERVGRLEAEEYAVVDLDTLASALTVDHQGIVGTGHGLVWLRLRSP
ncbi:hypothetical protein [Actinokineospora globicatena]|nr:hypothetical protein [Actinokineospora globicatena]